MRVLIVGVGTRLSKKFGRRMLVEWKCEVKRKSGGH